MSNLLSVDELDEIPKEELLNLIEQRLLELLSNDAEAFFQLMYRLDIAEEYLANALKSEDPPKRLANLVYDRQMQKKLNRENAAGQNKSFNDDPELLW